MCDYSLEHVRSRPANVGDKLISRDFGTGTRGFCAAEDAGMAVCLLPGTELAFAEEVTRVPLGLLSWLRRVIPHRTAIFREVNPQRSHTHHDALEFPDGRVVFLTHLREGQHATVLQLPARPAEATQDAPAEQPAPVG
jgi:hypothetical protein